MSNPRDTSFMKLLHLSFVFLSVFVACMEAPTGSCAPLLMSAEVEAVLRSGDVSGLMAYMKDDCGAVEVLGACMSLGNSDAFTQLLPFAVEVLKSSDSVKTLLYHASDLEQWDQLKMLVVKLRLNPSAWNEILLDAINDERKMVAGAVLMPRCADPSYNGWKAAKLAFANGNQDMIKMFLTHPKMDVTSVVTSLVNEARNLVDLKYKTALQALNNLVTVFPEAAHDYDPNFNIRSCFDIDHRLYGLASFFLSNCPKLKLTTNPEKFRNSFMNAVRKGFTATVHLFLPYFATSKPAANQILSVAGFDMQGGGIEMFLTVSRALVGMAKSSGDSELLDWDLMCMMIEGALKNDQLTRNTIARLYALLREMPSGIVIEAAHRLGLYRIEEYVQGLKLYTLLHLGMNEEAPREVLDLIVMAMIAESRENNQSNDNDDKSSSS